MGDASILRHWILVHRLRWKRKSYASEQYSPTRCLASVDAFGWGCSDLNQNLSSERARSFRALSKGVDTLSTSASPYQLTGCFSFPLRSPSTPGSLAPIDMLACAARLPVKASSSRLFSTSPSRCADFTHVVGVRQSCTRSHH